MDEFIIEYELENVKSRSTKKYLQEVVSSYNNKNYRSAVVLLYSVVIVDLIEKLKILKETYNDKNAEDILNEIKDSQEKKPTSPEWESLLIDKIAKRTELLNKAELKKIEQLKDDRNMCAHPIYDYDYQLINPNREQVRAHIRNMFESVFLKEALLCRDIFNELLIDISDYYNKVRIEGLERYINTKYYNKMNEVIKAKLFRLLWKLVFILDEPIHIKNRYVNYHALLYLVKENTNFYVSLVDREKDYYSNIKMSNLDTKKDYFSSVCLNVSDSPVIALICFISEYNKFYNLLSDSAKQVIENEAKKNISYYVGAYYINENMDIHIKKIKEFHTKIYCSSNWVSTEKYDCISHIELKNLLNKSKDFGSEKVVRTFIIDYFIKVLRWRDAKSIFDYLIEDVIGDFDYDDFIKLLNGMNQNSQIYELNEKEDVCKKVRSFSDKILGTNFNYTQYTNLW